VLDRSRTHPANAGNAPCETDRGAVPLFAAERKGERERGRAVSLAKSRKVRVSPTLPGSVPSSFAYDVFGSLRSESGEAGTL